MFNTNNRLGDLTLEEYRKLKYGEEVFKLTAEEKYGAKRVIVVRERFYDEVKAYADSVKEQFDRKLTSMTIEELTKFKQESRKCP